MSREKVVAIVEARMGSSRLPGKSLRPVAGKPLAERVIERVRRARAVEEVMLATSIAPADDALADLAGKIGVPVHRGSELDVLARILGAAHAAEATIHVQCWGDCPFAEPAEIDRVVARLRDSDLDLVGNNGFGGPRDLPYGLDVVAFRVSALERAERETRDNPYHREHGTTYIYQNPTLFRVESLPTPPDLHFPKLDVTVNRQTDYEFVCRVYDGLYPRKPDFTIRDVIDFIRQSPDLLGHENGAALRGPGA